MPDPDRRCSSCSANVPANLTECPNCHAILGPDSGERQKQIMSGVKLLIAAAGWFVVWFFIGNQISFGLRLPSSFFGSTVTFTGTWVLLFWGLYRLWVAPSKNVERREVPRPVALMNRDAKKSLLAAPTLWLSAGFFFGGFSGFNPVGALQALNFFMAVVIMPTVVLLLLNSGRLFWAAQIVKRTKSRVYQKWRCQRYATSALLWLVFFMMLNGGLQSFGPSLRISFDLFPLFGFPGAVILGLLGLWGYITQPPAQITGKTEKEKMAREILGVSRDREGLPQPASPPPEGPAQAQPMPPPPPPGRQPTIVEQPLPKTPEASAISARLSLLRARYPNLDLRVVDEELKAGAHEDAASLLDEIEGLVRKRDGLSSEMSQVTESLRRLSTRLAAGEIAGDAYSVARSELDIQKSELQEKIAQIDSKLFKEDYEKPVF